MERDEKEMKLIAEVGAASYKALIKAKSMVKPGAKLLDVAEATEKYLRESGFGCAFPLNLSVNSEAAHYTPSMMDDKVFGEKDIVKVDIGASKDGILGDNALTVDLSQQNGKLVEASQECLRNAISRVKAGVMVSDIGREIENTARRHGFKPIMNLGGHEVKTHELHAGIFVPNYDNHDDTQLEEGMVVAIEPFVTDGKRGEVLESDVCEIFGYVGSAPIRAPEARKVLAEIESNNEDEPFAVRWLTHTVGSKFALYKSIKELAMAGMLTAYPMLVEASNGMVSQSEVEVMVTKDGCEVLTK